MIVFQDQGPFSHLSDATFSLCLHMAEREEALISLPLLIRTLISLWGVTLMTSSKPNCLPKALLLNTITLGLGLKHEF